MRRYRGKRALDLALAGTAFVVFAPLIVGVALAVHLEDGGPPFSAQARVVVGGKPSPSSSSAACASAA